jgi:rubrerythrin
MMNKSKRKTVKKVIKGLTKASRSHANQAKSLKKVLRKRK